MKITLDNNCLISLEQNSVGSAELKYLISLYETNNHKFFIPAILASEKTKSGNYECSFLPFEERLKLLGLSNCELLLPIGYCDVTYLDSCIIPSEEDLCLEKTIHDILFPQKHFRYSESFTQNEQEKWRNRKCDVLAIWCHIHYHCDIFVTDDENYHKETKKPSLLKLGAKSIIKTKDLCSI